jgi:hypothetical protein
MQFLGVKGGWAFIFADQGLGAYTYNLIDTGLLIIELLIINAIGIGLIIYSRRQSSQNTQRNSVFTYSPTTSTSQLIEEERNMPANNNNANPNQTKTTQEATPKPGTSPILKFDPIIARNRVIAAAIGIIILAIINGISSHLPGADTHITGYFYVDDMIKLVIFAVMAGIILWLRPMILSALAFYFPRLIRRQNQSKKINIEEISFALANELTNIITIIILWPIAAQNNKPDTFIGRSSSFNGYSY